MEMDGIMILGGLSNGAEKEELQEMAVVGRGSITGDFGGGDRGGDLASE